MGVLIQTFELVPRMFSYGVSPWDSPTHDQFEKVALQRCEYPIFGRKEQNRAKTKRRPGSLGQEGKFPQFVSETSQHPLYTYIAKVGNKIEKTVVLDNFQTYK